MSARAVTVVVTGGVTLLVGVGSPVGLPTLATLVRLRSEERRVADKVRFGVAPAVRLTKFDQFTVPALKVPPPVALTKLTPTGNLSVTDGVVAVDGLAFVTLIV